MEKYVTTAKVVDGTLILTLPEAIRPVVWQMQLGQTKSSALEVREQGDTWLLVLKTPRQDVLEIAPFANRNTAVKALMAVARAMEKAQGQLGGQANYTGSPAYPVPALIGSTAASWLCRIVKWFFYLLLAAITFILIVIAALKLTAPEENQGMDSSSAGQLQQTGPAPSSGMPAEPPIGAPVSADDFLNGQ